MPKNGPVTYRVLHDSVWQRALVLADGQRTRLRVQPDGSVLVLNYPGFVWPPVAPSPVRKRKTAK